MKKYILTFVLAASCAICNAQFTSAPAFPGAEGHGRFATGGRGGSVIHVKNLNDSGDGSFRAAVSGNNKKIVVFDVGGVIALKSEIVLGKNTTILGQTAPSPGITIRYYTVRPNENNIIRFIRFRRGQERDVNDGADASWQRRVKNLMLDHCSYSWSIDEVASFYDNNNFTMQWCTVAESLVNAGHDKGAHGYGGIWGGKLASFHHNMIAHVANRGPRFNGARYNWTGYTTNDLYSTYKWNNSVEAENVDFRNCVMYNAQGTCYGGPGGGQINMVNNYYKAGPVSSKNMGVITTVTVGASGNSTTGNMIGMTSRYYISGNTTETNSGSITKNRDWNGIIYDNGCYELNGEKYSADAAKYYTTVTHTTISGKSCIKIKMDEPCPAGYVTTQTADIAYEKVLTYAGASLYRDDVDSRYAKEARTGTATYTGSVTGLKGLIDVVADCNGYTEANFGTGSHSEDFDTDDDGMSDEWETANGLNPNDASDATLYTIDTKGYYTNVEVYANSLVEDIIKAERADAQDTFEEYYPSCTIIKPTGINEISKGDSSDASNYYNIVGQHVTSSTKGIVIHNGKKIYNK